MTASSHVPRIHENAQEDDLRLEIPVQRHRLDNGLRVVFSVDDFAPVVAVNLWYGVGSRNEREGRTGFAHLFEHMMFQGSAHAEKNVHFEMIERAGGSLNGSTWFDRTNYFETVPSHHLELALWLEADRMGWLLPAMTQEKLENQRDVVKNERMWRYDNQPYGDWDERLQALAFPPDHPYHHSVIGSMEDIDAATLEDVEEFFRTYYVPNNAVLTVCGDFDPDTTMDMIERYFGEIPQGDPIPPVPGRVDLPKTMDGPLSATVTSDVPLPKVYMAFRIPPFTDLAFTAAEVCGSILGTGNASRFYRSLVRERRLAKDVGCFAFPLVTGCSIMVVVITGYAGITSDELVSAIHEEIAGLDNVSVSEVERAIALTETALASGLESVGERADMLSMFEMAFDDPSRLNRELDRYRSVSIDDVRGFASSYLQKENCAILTYLPENDATDDGDSAGDRDSSAAATGGAV